MTVELIRRNFPDNLDWEIVSENVPLGTRYEVIGYDRDFTIVNLETGRRRDIECYFLKGHNDTGWLPVVCFKVIREES